MKSEKLLERNKMVIFDGSAHKKIFTTASGHDQGAETSSDALVEKKIPFRDKRVLKEFGLMTCENNRGVI